jgi:uncharacterized protein
MKVLLVGGTGFIGSKLTEHLIELGHSVTVVSRTAKPAKQFKVITYSELSTAIGTADVVVNVAGANVSARRWTAKFRQELAESRILTTRRVVEAINASENKPRLVSISGSGYYGNTSVPCGEYSGHGSTFLAQLCVAWEAEAHKSHGPVTIARLGVVLDKDQGALPILASLTRWFLGAVLGSGNQYLPWIHVHDAVAALTYFVEHPECSGAYNIASPEPLTHREFMKTLGKVLKRPILFKIPELFLRAVKGRMVDVVVHGQHIVPVRILGTGYKFTYPKLIDALRNILSK